MTIPTVFRRPTAKLSALLVLWLLSWTMACNQTPFQLELVPTFGQSFADLDVFSFQLSGPSLKDSETTPVSFDVSVRDGKADLPGLVLDPEAKEKWLRIQALGLTPNSNVQAFGAGRFLFPSATPTVFRILLSRTESFGWLTRMDGTQNGRSTLLSKIVGHETLALPDGRVLLIGGVSQFTEDNGLITLEAREHLSRRVMIYNPNDGSFTTSSQEFTNPRVFHTATWIDESRILVVGGLGVIGTTAGGFQVQSLGTAEIVDVSSPNNVRIYTAPHQPKRARAFHRAVPLSDGSILFVGGVGGPLLGSDGTARQGQEVLYLEMYDRQTETFLEVPSVAADPRMGRVWHRATAFSNDTVLVTGGLRIDENGRRKTAEEHLLLTRNGSSWNLSFIDVEATGGRKRFDHTATLAQDGSKEWIVVAGGRYVETSAMLRPIEIWDNQGKLVSGTNSLTETRYAHGAVWVPEQKEVLLGGGLSTSSGGLKAVFQGEAIKIPNFTVESRPQIQEKSGRYRCDPVRLSSDGRSFWLGGAIRDARNERSYLGLDTGEIYTPRVNNP
ncbi:MAG: hypothetical protein H6728_17925 [Myxococcales bacterium]|nr:hypothetical protein [Myxococcales bacterium]MCB9644955.1 hypothetical protein [Myxococcales bacterium]